MTAYQQPTFTVPTGYREPETCTHGWLDAKGRCAFCGTVLLVPSSEVDPSRAK